MLLGQVLVDPFLDCILGLLICKFLADAALYLFKRGRARHPVFLHLDDVKTVLGANDLRDVAGLQAFDRSRDLVIELLGTEIA
jgi:hypothetical protein